MTNATNNSADWTTDLDGEVVAGEVLATTTPTTAKCGRFVWAIATVLSVLATLFRPLTWFRRKHSPAAPASDTPEGPAKASRLQKFQTFLRPVRAAKDNWNERQSIVGNLLAVPAGAVLASVTLHIIAIGISLFGLSVIETNAIVGLALACTWLVFYFGGVAVYTVITYVAALVWANDDALKAANSAVQQKTKDTWDRVKEERARHGTTQPNPQV